MGDSMRKNNMDDFLFKEYDSAQNLTYHVDDMRSKLTQFFIALSSIALATVSVIVKKDVDHDFLGVPWLWVSVVALLMCVMLGFLFVLIIAKLRRTQIEHFHITNNIREYFLEQSPESEKLKSVVMLSKNTIPKPTRNSGSYYWVLLIIMLTSFLFSSAVFLITSHFSFDKIFQFFSMFFCFIVFVYILDQVYMRNAAFFSKES